MGAWSRFIGSLWPSRRRRVIPLRAVEEKPVAIQYTPSSILSNPEGHSSWYCEGRKRYATCSGVAWYHENHLACVNLLGNIIHVYRFDREQRLLVLIQALPIHSVTVTPENLSFSPDGSIVAITDSEAIDVKIFRVDAKSHEISLDGFVRVRDAAGGKAHGVGFSPCGRFLAFTTIDKPGVIRLYRLKVDSSGIQVEPFQVVVNTQYPLVPKGIDFSKDGSRVAICFGPNVSQRASRGRGGRLEIRAFDPLRGIAPEPSSCMTDRHSIGVPEDVRFFDRDAFVVLTQQGSDAAIVVPVHPLTSELGGVVQTLRNPSARLSFPHGAGVSADGRWVALTSYGDDKFGIYAVATPGCPVGQGNQ